MKTANIKAVKYIFLFLAVALMVAAGALIPRAASAMQDSSVLNKNFSEPIHEISLSIRELPAIGKLSLLAKLGSESREVSISPESAKMTEAEVTSKVDEILQVFYKDDLTPPCNIKDYKIDFSPSIVYGFSGRDDSEIRNIFWTVDLYPPEERITDPYIETNPNESDASASINGTPYSLSHIQLIIDDESGGLFSISFESNNPIFDVDNFQNNISKIVGDYLYLSGLDSNISSADISYPSDYVIMSEYTWYDILYGEICVQFVHSIYAIGTYISYTH